MQDLSRRIFGANYQSTESLSRTTTTSSTFQDKVSVTTPALVAGTYRVNYTMVMDTAFNKTFEAKLRNSTDAVDFNLHIQEAKATADRILVSGYANIIFAGVAKTITLQFRSPDNAATVGADHARLSIWRVA